MYLRGNAGTTIDTNIYDISRLPETAQGTNEHVYSSEGWYEFTFPGTVTLTTASDPYWVAFWSDTTVAYAYDTTPVQQFLYKSATFSPNWPDFPGITTYSWRISIYCSFGEIPPETFTPPDPVNLQHTTGNYWVNYTWEAGSGNVTDSYNVSINGTWTNGTTNTYAYTETDPEGWVNITVFAYNNTGQLSQGSLSDSIQVVPAPTPTATSTTSEKYKGGGQKSSTWKNDSNIPELVLVPEYFKSRSYSELLLNVSDQIESYIHGIQDFFSSRQQTDPKNSNIFWSCVTVIGVFMFVDGTVFHIDKKRVLPAFKLNYKFLILLGLLQIILGLHYLKFISIVI